MAEGPPPSAEETGHGATPKGNTTGDGTLLPRNELAAMLHLEEIGALLNTTTGATDANTTTMDMTGLAAMDRRPRVDTRAATTNEAGPDPAADITTLDEKATTTETNPPNAVGAGLGVAHHHATADSRAEMLSSRALRWTLAMMKLDTFLLLSSYLFFLEPPREVAGFECAS